MNKVARELPMTDEYTGPLPSSNWRQKNTQNKPEQMVCETKTQWQWLQVTWQNAGTGTLMLKTCTAFDKHSKKKEKQLDPNNQTEAINLLQDHNFAKVDIDKVRQYMLVMNERHRKMKADQKHEERMKTDPAYASRCYASRWNATRWNA